ncbi:hypothetical protein HOP50_03g20600 [Chloropicon primus]|uniref:Uncharacterized protein n=1 Tax=Chloropicon primus TaxID=1764295 RepID=A0A5B8MJL0_9CHLO|nr:hypothetical protein A3770_03p20600 [Chloropicon primus]UPQ98754.1 hypothetical protein HOP50_03g20600 [Chloropicon primus]|eukprot:QDZ19542.1 hypothetical protein A3770_03p20600 [Chloropicon primus]
MTRRGTNLGRASVEERRVGGGACSVTTRRHGPLLRKRPITTRATDADGSGIIHTFQTAGAVSTAAYTLIKFGRLGVDKKFRKKQVKWPKLFASVAIDAIGVSSYALPGIGESEDVVWAPISATLVQLIYGTYWLTALDLLEEGLPFSDFVPTATLAWAIEYTQIRRVIPFLPKPKEDEEDEGKKEGKKESKK